VVHNYQRRSVGLLGYYVWIRSRFGIPHAAQVVSAIEGCLYGGYLLVPGHIQNILSRVQFRSVHCSANRRVIADIIRCEHLAVNWGD